jgi:hypothetical protein
VVAVQCDKNLADTVFVVSAQNGKVITAGQR